MGYQHWSYALLHGLCMDAFEKFGFTEAEANIIQDVLLTADLYGIESHGMLLCAASADDSRLRLLTVDGDIEDGCEIG